MPKRSPAVSSMKTMNEIHKHKKPRPTTYQLHEPTMETVTKELSSQPDFAYWVFDFVQSVATPALVSMIQQFAVDLNISPVVQLEKRVQPSTTTLLSVTVPATISKNGSVAYFIEIIAMPTFVAMIQQYYRQLKLVG